MSEFRGRKMTPELEKKLRETVTTWAREFMEQRYKYLVRKQVKATGQLTSKMRFEIINNVNNDARALLIHFAKHGRFIDMKHAEGGEEQVKGLLEWIKAKGLENDMIDRWWSKNNYKRVPKDILNRIAWGIIKNNQKRQKRQRWFNKPKEAALYKLSNLVIAALAPAAGTDLKNLLTPKI